MSNTAHEDQYTCSPEEDEAFNNIQARQDAERPHEADARMLDAQLAADMGHSVSSTLETRGKRYGDFKSGAAIMQSLKDEVRNKPGWDRLNAHQREAIDMILHKLGRILNGDPNYADTWHDIGGYAHLVERELGK